MCLGGGEVILGRDMREEIGYSYYGMFICGRDQVTSRSASIAVVLSRVLSRVYEGGGGVVALCLV